MDLCEPGPGTFPKFVAKVAEVAVADHEAGIKARRTGKNLCYEIAEGHRTMHHRLASTVYNQTRRSLEVADKEREEAGL